MLKNVSKFPPPKPYGKSPPGRSFPGKSFPAKSFPGNSSPRFSTPARAAANFVALLTWRLNSRFIGTPFEAAAINFLFLLACKVSPNAARPRRPGRDLAPIFWSAGDLLKRALKSCCGVGPWGAGVAGDLAVSASKSASESASTSARALASSGTFSAPGALASLRVLPSSRAVGSSRVSASSGALVAASGAGMTGNLYLLAGNPD